MKRGTRYFLISSGECGMSADESKSQSGSAWVKAEDYEVLERKLKHIKMAMDDFETLQMRTPSVLILGLRDIIESEGGGGE